MPSKIKPKRSYTTGSVPTTSDLDINEIAISWADNKLFTKTPAGNIVSVTLGGGTDSVLRSLFTPAAPTSVTASAGNAQATVSWTAPTGTISQAPITDYVVQYSSNSGSSWTTFADGTSTATSATVTSLTNGTAYIFQVAAVNAAGTGAYSTASSSVAPYAGITPVAVMFVRPLNGSQTSSISGTYSVPTGATTMKAWAVGQGSLGGSGGGAGGCAYKTWSVSGGSTVSYTVGYLQNVNGVKAPNSTVTFGGTTITGYGANSSTGGSFAGGDGGASGGNGRSKNYGGSVGGNSIAVLGCGAGPCSDVSGLLAAVSLAGGVSTQGCSTTSYNFGPSTIFSQFGCAGYSTDTKPAYGGSGVGAGFGGGSAISTGGLGWPPSGAVILYFT